MPRPERLAGPALTPEQADLAGYLRDLGFGELYLRAPAAQPLAAAPESAASAARSSAPAASPAARNLPLPGLTAASPGIDPALLALSPEERAQQLAELAAQAAICTACQLSEKRQKVVFGSGDPNADLMFIGEGPGAEEDRRGLPFVGPAGELLTKIIEAIKLRREQVYIANIVKCRPPGNRDPEPDEAAACRGFLDRQIALVQPKVIVALGRVAAQTLLGNSLPLGRMRGQWWQVMGIPTMVTYHPAALLRSPAWKRPTWEDMQQVRDRLAAS